MKHTAPDGRIQPRPRAHLYQQLEVALAVLNQPVGCGSVGRHLDGDPEVCGELASQLTRRQPGQGPWPLPLAQPVQHVVATDPELMAALRVIAMLERGDLPLKKVSLLRVDPHTEHRSGRERRHVIEVPRRIRKAQLANRGHREAGKNDNADKGRRCAFVERLTVDLEPHRRQDAQLLHDEGAAPDGGIRSTVPGGIRSGSSIPLNAAINLQRPGFP